MIKDINQLPKEIKDVIDSYLSYQTIIQIPIDDYLFHFLTIRGIYLLYSNKKISYIGMSSNIGSRLSVHVNSTTDKKNVTRIKIVRFQDNIDIVAIEARLIKHFNPFYNKQNQHLDYFDLSSDFDSNKLVALIECLEKEK